MTRILGHYVSLEMLALCAAELALSFVLIYAMLVSGAEPATAALPLHPASALLAARLVGTIGATSLAIGLYRPEVCLERRRLLLNAAVVVAIALPAMLMARAAFRGGLPGALPRDLLRLLKILLAWTICLFATRWGFSTAVRMKLFARRVLVLGDDLRAASMATAIRGQQARFFELAALPSTAGTIATANDAAIEAAIGGGAAPAHDLPPPEALRQARVWGVVVACDDRRALPADALLAYRTRGIRVMDDVEFREQQLGRIDIDHISPARLALAEGFRTGALSALLRRGLDVVVSLALLLLTMPLLLLVAIAIKLDSRGPIFYRQQRVGLHGRVFTLMKFRSMRVDAEQGRPLWAAQNDPRITRVGNFIRATRIDELPQILCVLRGEMSFVGPRPERPHFVEQLAQAIPFYRHRSAVKPGITGWAQVNFPYGASVEDAREKLSYDLYYVKNRTLFLDLLILISTIRVILFQEGAR